MKKLFLILTIALLLLSCGDEDTDKDIEVKYEVIGTFAEANIKIMNKDGAYLQNNYALPWEYSFYIKEGSNFAAEIQAIGLSSWGTIRAYIYADGEMVNYDLTTGGYPTVIISKIIN